MLTIDDYMKLPKKRLAEMLVERDELEETIENKIAEKIVEIVKDFPIMPSWPISPNPIQPNPPGPAVLYGCPTPGSSNVLYCKADTESISVTDGKEHKPSFIE